MIVLFWHIHIYIYIYIQHTQHTHTKRKPPCIGGMELVSLSCNRVFISAESVGRCWCKIAIATKWYQFHTTDKCGFLFMPWKTYQYTFVRYTKLVNKIGTAVAKVITFSIMTASCNIHLLNWYGYPNSPACTTATAHIFAFEFDLVMDLMGIFSNKQTEVSTGEKTYDMTVYWIWKHAAWSKHAVKPWLYVEHPVGWMLFAWHFFNHHLGTEKRLSTTTMRWLGKPQQKTNLPSVSIHSTILYHQ